MQQRGDVTRLGLPSDGGGLPPPLGSRVLIVSAGLERSYDRARVLEQLGYRTISCGNPFELRSLLAEHLPEAVVIDLMREGPALAETAASVRACTTAPILVVGAAGSLTEMTRCLEAGADDYCRPRCPTEEIDLRLRAIFRRLDAAPGRRAELVHSVVRVGDLEIDPGRQEVRKRGQTVPLSPTEFRLLSTLAERAGEVVPARALIARVWGTQYANESHYLRLYIRYLRQKLEDNPSQPRYIVNRWGSGYTLDGARPVAA